MGESSIINTGVLKNNPFPGIRPFTSAEEKLYFGRNEAISEVMDLLKSNRFVALAGASASGKSSLIQSGLIPSLLTEKGQEWVPIVVRPGKRPMENLIRGFQKVFPNKVKESDVEACLKGHMDLSEMIIGNGLGSHRYFLVVDQFEELFMCDPMEKPIIPEMEMRRFLNMLYRSMSAGKPEIYILLAIRSDFLEESSTHRQLAELMNKSKYLLPPMSNEAISACISGPIQQAGVRLETGFTEYILEDLEGLELPLPKLQFALMLSWEKWLENGDKNLPLTINDYQSVGSVDSAPLMHFEAAYDSLDESGKVICEKLFKTITSRQTQSNGAGRQVSLGNIARILHCSPEEVTEVVEVFRNHGKGVISPLTGRLQSETLLEISHESLIRIWDRLEQWVQEEEESVKMYLRLSEASALYQRGKTELWTGADLQLAIEWRESQKPSPAWGVQYDPAFERAMVFLNTSEEELAWEEERKVIQQKRRLLLNRSIAIFMAVLVVILVVVFLTTRYRPDTVDKPAMSAVEEVPVEESGLPAEAYNAGDDITSPGETDLDPVSAETEDPVPDIRVEETRVEPVRSVEREETVRQTRPPANQNRRTERPDPPASTGKAEAISLARGLARESKTIERQPDLQGLLAYEAYRINQESGGKGHDVEVFLGLYSAMKKLISPAYNIYPNMRSSVKDQAWLRRTGSILTVSGDGSAKILSGSYASRASQISLPGTGFANECLAISPDEKKAIVGTNGGGIVVLELENQGRVIQQDTKSGKTVLFLESLGNTGRFVSAGTDSKIYVWSFEDLSLEVLLTATSRISALSSTSEGRTLAYGTRNGNLYRISADGSGEARLIGEFGQNQIRALSFSPGGRNLAVGLLDGSVRVLSVAGRNTIARLRAAGAGITDLKYSPDGRFLAAASRDGKVYLWNTSDWQASPAVFDENNGFVLSLCFSRSGEYFYSGSVDFPRFVSRPVESSTMAGEFCSLLSRNLSAEEWQQYIGNSIPYRRTCPGINE